MVSLSNEHLRLSEIFQHQQDVDHALRSYFKNVNLHPDRFAIFSPGEIQSDLEARLVEQDKLGGFSLLTAIEAAFRVDFWKRVQNKKRDDLSRAMRQLHKKYSFRVSLEDEIFEAWLENTSVSPGLIGDLKGAFRYRHWIAHGRYWTPKLGRRYDFYGLATLAQAVFTEVEFIS